MKKICVSAVLSLTACCFLTILSPLKAHADTISLTFENVGPGNNSGGVYTYPYNFSIDGSSTLTSLMCFSYTDEIYTGESWTATVLPVTTVAEEEAAYLFSVASNASTPAQTVSDAQWAVWELFDSALTSAPDQSGTTTELNAAANFVSTAPSSFFTGYQLYIPVAGTQIPSGDGLPQSFLGESFSNPNKTPDVYPNYPQAETPEPNSVLLLGTGLLLLAGEFFRRKWAAKGGHVYSL
jgi:hypothetical protein